MFWVYLYRHLHPAISLSIGPVHNKWVWYCWQFSDFDFSITGRYIPSENGRYPDCIDINYPDQNSTRKYYNTAEKNGLFEILTERNHTIIYDSANNTAQMKNSNGQYVKMERQLIGEKYSRYKNSVLNVIVPCKKPIEKRRFTLLTDIVTNKPRRERYSKEWLYWYN